MHCCLFQEKHFAEIYLESVSAADCNYIYDKLLPAKGPVAVVVVERSELKSKLHVIRHVLENVSNLKETEVRERYSSSKNTQRQREKQKDPEYSRRENERLCEQSRAKKLQEQAKMQKIPKLSVISVYVSNVDTFTGEKTMNYIVRKQVEIVEVTTYMHERL